jgi:biopolymer transport protein ExbD
MSSDSRTLDVWITDRNTVYRGVPFTVVIDWVQEGRLLEADRVRPAGSQSWQRLEDHPLLTVYLPKQEANRAEDEAEALEKIELDFEPRKKPEEAEDDDVDMIPLIDISMVLLVFFMMTANDLLTATPIETPKVTNALAISTSNTFGIGIAFDKEKRLQYYAKDEYGTPLSEEALLELVQLAVDNAKSGPPKMIINSAADVPFDTIQNLTVQLQKMGCNMQANVKQKPKSGGGGGAP